jgi:hypothetical protein
MLYTQERREKKKQQKRTRPPSSGEPQELVVEKNMCHYKYLAVQESHWEEKEEGDPFVFHIRPFFLPTQKYKNPERKRNETKGEGRR